MEMTLSIFAIMLTIFVTCNILFTEAIKKAFEGSGKPHSSNLIALISAIVVGGVGSTLTYIFLGITFNVCSIICIPVFIIAVWVGSMIGYDKIFQLIEQIKKIKF